MIQQWNLFFDNVEEFDFVRVGRTIGRRVGTIPLGTNTADALVVVETGPQTYIAVPRRACVPLGPAERFAEAQAILTAAIEQVRFVGLKAQAVQTLFANALSVRESQIAQPVTPPDEKASSDREGKLARYRLVIANLIHSIEYSYDPARQQLYYIHDTPQNQFVLLCVGWESNSSRVFHPIFFIHLKGEIVCIEIDNTDGNQVLSVLVENGIPKEEIFPVYIYPRVVMPG